MHSIKKTLKVILLAISIFQSHVVMCGMSATESIPSKDADIVINNERQKLEQATIETEKIKAVAKLMINETNGKRAKNEISELEAAKIIGEQNYQIERADERLAAIVKESVDAVEDAESQEESYMSQLLAGAQNLGARLLAPFKSGYGSTEEEKGIAKAIIAELDKQLELLGEKYKEKIKATSNNEEKSRLLREYNEIRQSFESEIYQQKLVTGEQMSANRKLFWGAVATAGALVGGVLAKQYLGAEVQMPVEGLPERTLESSFGPAKEAVIKAGERVIATEPQREFGELKSGEVVITPEAAREVAEFAEQVGKKALEERDITVYGAKPGTKSYFEQLQEVGAEAEPSESALARKEQRETFQQRAAKQQAERQEQLKKSKSIEEQQKETAELGSYLSTGAQSILGSSQYRSLEEEPVALTDAEKEIIEKEREQAMVKAQQAQSALDKGAESVVVEEVSLPTYEGETVPGESLAEKGTKRLLETEPVRVPEEEPFGGITTYEGETEPGESLAEKGMKRLVETEPVRVPEEEPFGGITTYEGETAPGEPLAEKGMKRLLETEPVRVPEEEPFGGVTTYEGTEDESLMEQVEEALRAGARRPLNPEEGGI